MNTTMLPTRAAAIGVLAVATLLATPAVAAADDASPTDPTLLTTSEPVASEPSPSETATSETSTSKASTSEASSEPSTSETSAIEESTTKPPTSPADSLPSTARLEAAPSFTVVPVGGHERQQAGYAGGFLAGRLAAGGDHFTYPGTTFADAGLTLDAVLGLDGAGVGASQAAASTAYVAAHVSDYIGAGGEQYVGATAKSLVAAVAQGADPTSFGGVDLVASLESLQTPSGRFSDKSQFGDYSNAFGQSLAIIGLQRAGRDVSDAAVTFLLAQQCADGGFRLSPDESGCTSDTDATAVAVQAVIAAQGQQDPAAMKGLSYLTARQAVSGGIGGTGPTSGVNANSTGLAAAAFAAGGLSAPLLGAQHYLEGLQYGCSFPTALRGGIAYDAAGFASQKQAGSGAKVTDQDVRSTAQATLGLSGQSLLTVSAHGATTDAPSPSCASTTRTSPPSGGSGGSGSSSGSRTHGGSTGAGRHGGASAESGAAHAATPGGALAYTGANLVAPAVLGGVLVGLGALAIAASRRRGKHA